MGIQQEIKSGFLLIDKPQGWTSFDIVAKLRGITKVKKIGHAGTLDPLATGLLLIAIGRKATREIQQYVKLDKVYTTTAILGAVSDSYDADGTIYKEGNEFTEGQGWKILSYEPSGEEIEQVVQTFQGKIQQVPPMYSAKKVGGKKLYELAREGKVIEREPSNIEIYKVEITRYEYPEVDITVHCSTGTYIRSLVHDIGQQLGVGAYINVLRRTHIADFDVKDAWQIEDITRDNFEEKLFGEK